MSFSMSVLPTIFTYSGTQFSIVKNLGSTNYVIIQISVECSIKICVFSILATQICK